MTGAIIGSARRFSAVRCNIGRGIVLAWVVTMPMSAAIAALAYWASAAIAG